VRNTSRLSSGPGLNGGDWESTFVSDDADRVQYNVTTIHHGALGNSGFVHFWISFTESYTQSVDQQHSDPVKLRWRDSEDFSASELGLPGWKFVLDAFDGSHTELPGPNPFVVLNATQDGGMQLATVDPKTLNWP